jgi:2-polyprenyl-6-methoxyphenol hydroxylase-like FAD-dependent oxidoreductase
MAPNLGAGINAAIESAAALANSISKLSRTNPPLDEICKVLNDYYTKRHSRVNSTCDTANQLTRIEALVNWPIKMLALHGITVLGDFLTGITVDYLVGAEILESLPVPERSLKKTKC